MSSLRERLIGGIELQLLGMPAEHLTANELKQPQQRATWTETGRVIGSRGELEL